MLWNFQYRRKTCGAKRSRSFTASPGVERARKPFVYFFGTFFVQAKKVRQCAAPTFANEQVLRGNYGALPQHPARFFRKSGGKIMFCRQVSHSLRSCDTCRLFLFITENCGLSISFLAGIYGIKTDTIPRKTNLLIFLTRPRKLQRRFAAPLF